MRGESAGQQDNPLGPPEPPSACSAGDRKGCEDRKSGESRRGGEGGEEGKGGGGIDTGAAE
jgi:hypothetical protein